MAKKSYKELLAENVELKEFLKTISNLTEEDGDGFAGEERYAYLFGRARGFACIALKRCGD